MKENVLDVLMYLFENYFYDDVEDEPDRASMEDNLHEAGFSNGEIDKAFNWLDGLAEQRFQPEFNIQTDQPIRIFVDCETNRIDTACLDRSPGRTITVDNQDPAPLGVPAFQSQVLSVPAAPTGFPVLQPVDQPWAPILP